MYKEVYAMEIMDGFSESGMCVLVLFEPDSNRNIPIVIGEHEAEMIVYENGTNSARRPMTHELISSLFDHFSLELKEVTIDRFEEGIFYATLHISDGFTVKKIDARASDAIVLAIRHEIAIQMDTAVIDSTAYPAQKDYDDSINFDDPSETTIEALEALLEEYEANEEFEKAQELMDQIRRLKGKQE